MSRILIIEDDRDIRELLADLLVDEGYSVEQAANGADALDALRRDGLPDVILLDLMMPVMDGVQFRMTQLADPRIAAIPVILLTAAGSAVPAGDMLAEVAAIPKPIRLDDLMSTLARICREPRSGDSSQPGPA